MDIKSLGLTICVLLLFVLQTEAKSKRSYTRLEYSQMSDERLCQRKRCGKKNPKGSWCEVVRDDEGRRRPTCVCPTNCDATDRSPVCSVYGREYKNKCFLHMEACKKRRIIKIAYEGQCIASQAKCTNDELGQFPFRLLDWFVHLKDTDEFGSLDPKKTITSITDAERTAVAQWKFEQLDKNNDGKLTNKELKAFRYALMPLEHCAKQFFKICDTDNNRKLLSREWSSCLVTRSWEWYKARNDNAEIDVESPDLH